MPVIGLVQIGTQPTADRYTYIPLLGLFVAIAWAADDGLSRLAPRRLAIELAAAAALVLALAAVAHAQVKTWRDSVAVWQHALEVTHGNYGAENNLGDALARRGQRDAAIAHFRAALLMRPDFIYAHDNLGVALAAQGHLLTP